MDGHLIPHIATMVSSNAARFLTTALRKFLWGVPKAELHTVSSVSIRNAGITEMAVGNVGIYQSHARSGHKVLSNQ